MTAVPPTAALTLHAPMPSDYDLCLAFDHSASTDWVWQMALDDREGAVGVAFRRARLPREVTILYPRAGDGLLQSWAQGAFFLVAQRGDRVLGYVNAREESPQETAWVADLVVDRPYRGEGIGAALLRAARQWALERNLRHLIVEVQTKNDPAIGFLLARGLVFCGYNDLYYPSQDIAVFFGQSLR
jgi:GNAT superfamily N-acetyltransferase